MGKKTMKKLRAEARTVVAGYDPACGDHEFNDVVIRLAAIGCWMAEAGGPYATAGRM